MTLSETHQLLTRQLGKPLTWLVYFSFVAFEIVVLNIIVQAIAWGVRATP